jgi:hypothetical protein
MTKIHTYIDPCSNQWMACLISMQQIRSIFTRIEKWFFNISSHMEVCVWRLRICIHRYWICCFRLLKQTANETVGWKKHYTIHRMKLLNRIWGNIIRNKLPHLQFDCWWSCRVNFYRSWAKVCDLWRAQPILFYLIWAYA